MDFSGDSVSEDAAFFTDRPESSDAAIPELPDGLLTCEGLPRSKWVTKFVTLLNAAGDEVGEGVCHCVDSDLVVGNGGPLGDHQVAIHVTASFDEHSISADWLFSMRAWNIEHVVYNGFSLLDHQRRDFYNRDSTPLSDKKSGKRRSYEAVARNPPRQFVSRVDALLSQESINLVSSSVCCRKNCVQPFPRDKIKAARQQLWGSRDFKFKSHIKLEVHRQFHNVSDGTQMVTLEGVDVCAKAWQLILGVSKSTFYRKRIEVSDGKRGGPHGNFGSSRPGEHIRQATATLKCMIDTAADHMPHKSKADSSGDRVVSRSLSSSWKWKDSIPDINIVNAQLGLRAVSQSSLSKIWKISFPEYSKKAPGDNFARCSTCDDLVSLAKAAIPGSDGELLQVKKLQIHLDDQRAHRELYYANRSLSIKRPDSVVTIIHDKMDHGKTASPLFSHKTKANDAWMKLPIAVTGMIAHGHGDVRYAHYGLDIYPSDSNHTVGSIAKLLRDLEDVPISMSRALFSGSGSAPIFEAVLQGTGECSDSLPPMEAACGIAVPLPPVLNVQLDNAASDNKNRYVFYFWSLLVARGIFREIYVNFLLVGHTHEDIDALFGRWSMKLKENDYPTIPLLMKSFMDAESQPVIPHLIEEVPDFKGFIDNFIAEGDEALTGHSEGQQFKFYMDGHGWPKMQYKLKCTDTDWLPTDGIKLWREDVETGLPILPFGDPKPLIPIPMKNLENIIKGIGGFIGLWESLCEQDSSGEYRRKHEHLIRYWQGVKLALSQPIPLLTELRHGFWPMTRISRTMQDEFTMNGELREPFARDPHFIGRRCDRSVQSFRPGRDIYAGYFVVLRPHDDDDVKPFWIARALTGFDDDRNHPGCIEIQFYKPASKSVAIHETYRGWDSERSFKWRVDTDQIPQWMHGDSIITSWKSNARSVSQKSLVSIPTTQVEIIRESLLQFRN